ncbi:unnamed protein product [Leptosia nina]|uniref:Uncharacterized protein n=1 Tax=Leptosia nina TaxID=320188 RepID=A0AAV1JDF4_9NEOP
MNFVTKERYDLIIGRYNKFIESLDNLEGVPEPVFDPLNQKQIDELKLIRDISAYLQKKKDEDVAKNNSEAQDTETTPAQEEPKEN